MTKTLSGAEALDLWLTITRLPISRKERATLDAGESFKVQVDSKIPPGGSHDLVVTTWGDAAGSLALLMHGWGGHRGQLTPFVEPLLAAGFRVAAFDAPAHGDVPGTQTSGYQMAECMLAVAARVGQPTVVLAHSLGTLALTVALQEGLTPHKVVLFGPMRRLTDTVEPFLQMNDLTPETGEAMMTETEARWGGSDVWTRTALDQVLPKFKIPALIIHDRNDETTPYISGVAVARAWKSAKLITTRGLGHRGVLKDPDVIAKVIEFLSSTSNDIIPTQGIRHA
jgi:pimeloyl-ACP methyl ester carboxylesterase